MAERAWRRPPTRDDDAPAVVELAARLRELVASSPRIAVVGAAGSGRRSATARAVGADAWWVPALASRLPRALGAICASVGVTAPLAASPAALRAIWHGGAAGSSATVVVDARLGADAAVLGALEPPPGWTRILLLPPGAMVRGDRVLTAPPPARPRPVDAADAELWDALCLADPWQGIALEDLAALAGGDLAALIAARHAHALEGERVAAPVHDAAARAGRAPEPLARRFAAVIARHADDADARVREHDNLIAAIAIARRLGDAALAARFLPAAEAWIDDPSARPAAAVALAAGAAIGVDVQRLRAKLDRA
jgi:hypothetical protein